MKGKGYEVKGLVEALYYTWNREVVPRRPKSNYCDEGLRGLQYLLSIHEVLDTHPL